MEAITDNTYIDWIYNRFVEAVRNNDYQKTFVYEDVLRQINNLLPAGRKYSAMKRRAKVLTNEIIKAYKSGSLRKLHFKGAEFVADYKRAIAEYEQELRNLNVDEETFQYLITQKSESYGND